MLSLVCMATSLQTSVLILYSNFFLFRLIFKSIFIQMLLCYSVSYNIFGAIRFAIILIIYPPVMGQRILPNPEIIFFPKIVRLCSLSFL